MTNVKLPVQIDRLHSFTKLFPISMLILDINCSVVELILLGFVTSDANILPKINFKFSLDFVSATFQKLQANLHQLYFDLPLLLFGLEFL